MSRKIPQAITDFFAKSDIALTLSDPRSPDDPLIFANDAFYRMTGYSEEEALGANCRFMQGKETRKSSRDAIKEDFAQNRDSTVLIRNYRKSGEAFDNFLYIFSVFDGTDIPLFRIGSQFEVPETNRAQAFEAHAVNLRNGLETLNKGVELSDHRLVDAGTLVGISIKELLMARLDNLRAS